MNPSTLSGITANGATAAQSWAGGNGTIAVRGVFGGATLKLQWCEKPSGTDADWFDVTKADGTALAFAAQGQSQVTEGTG